jgi:hypothetical protein
VVVGAALILLLTTAPLAAAELYIPPVSTETGQIFSLSVAYRAGDVPLVATQNDLVFSADFVVQQRADGGPDCVVNPAVNKPATSFAFRPPTPDGNPVVRALVLAFDNLDPLPDGATLYSCRIGTPLRGSGGEKTVLIERREGADSVGNAVPLGAENGRVIVAVTEPDFGLYPDDVAGRRGETVSLAIRFDGYPGAVRGVVHSLNAYPATFGALACGLDAMVPGQARFTYEPAGCEAAETCTIVTAEVTLDAEPPDQFVLYRCALRIDPDLVPGASYPVSCRNLDARGRNGEEILASCSGASLSVLSDPTAAPSMTPTATPIATASPARTVTSTAPPTVTVNPCGSCPRGVPCQIVNGAPICIILTSSGDDDDGCAITGRSRRLDWLSALAFPMACWLMRRRVRP